GRKGLGPPSSGMMVVLDDRATQVPEMLGTLSGTRTSRRAGSPVAMPRLPRGGAAGRESCANAADEVSANNVAATGVHRRVLLTCVLEWLNPLSDGTSYNVVLSSDRRFAVRKARLQ